jgi:hypothetical protein
MKIAAKPRRLKFIAHDPKFDCNIFAYRVNNTVPERTEPREMSEWCQYPWESFKILKERGRLTPSLIIFHQQIVEGIGARYH